VKMMDASGREQGWRALEQPGREVSRAVAPSTLFGLESW
jgi:hypothetical protein